MNFLLSLLKNPKIISALVGLALSSGAIWYGVNLIQDKGALEEKLKQKEEELSTAQQTLQQEQERFEKTIDNYDRLMSNYMDMVLESETRSRNLQSTIRDLSQQNEEFEQCMNMQIPDDLMDNIFHWEVK